LLIARIPIGMTFVAAGFMKLRGGVGAFVNQSMGAVPSYLTPGVGRAYLYALPTVELLIGVLLILGWFTRTTSFIAALVLLSILMAVDKSFWVPQARVPNANVVLMSVALLLFFAGPGSCALDSLKFGRSSKAPRSE
jgi:uncharacterized membrane protein YphA (DoxX/SURF4 family)